MTSTPLISPIDVDAAPASVKATLDDVRKRYGFLPNLYRVFAQAPIALDAYLAVADIFNRSSFSATERNVVLLTVSRANECRYCVAVHSTVGDMQKDPQDVIEAIRNDQPIGDPKLEALRRLTEALVNGRGHADAEIARFVAAGYQPSQVVEVLVGVTLKTLSNYTNHLAITPLDGVFEGRAWSPPNR
jgi:uncharacterized peroxidase-related enzyme